MKRKGIKISRKIIRISLIDKSYKASGFNSKEVWMPARYNTIRRTLMHSSKGKPILMLHL